MIELKLPYSYIYGYKFSGRKELTSEEKFIQQGVERLNRHELFKNLCADVEWKSGYSLKNNRSAAFSSYDDRIVVNRDITLSSDEWAHVIAHCMLHRYFGHYDRDKMPEMGLNLNMPLWNKACDIYVEQFLHDISLGRAICPVPSEKYFFRLDDEVKIYDKLLEIGDDGRLQEFGTASADTPDMKNLNKPLTYKNGVNPDVEFFGATLAALASDAVVKSGGYVLDEGKNSVIMKAARWFIANYPLLGGIAAGFKIVEDEGECLRQEVQTGAVDIGGGVIYANSACRLTEEEWKFVLAHEFLHAGLQHDARCQGRNAFVWNCAVDFVVNGWLKDMEVGTMPQNVLYDENFKNLSAEAIYDILIADMRRSLKLQTFRGYHKGDLLTGAELSFSDPDASYEDDYFLSALKHGLEYSEFEERTRCYIPAGLIQEIRSLTQPPIKWETNLAEWFSEHFPLEEKVRSYARPSRRQSSTPDIPRPGYRINDAVTYNRTFGVCLDTSGSVRTEEIGKALGAIASYAVAREVKFVRIVFFDAAPYDCGYMAAEDIAGRVEVKGRGGTALQPAVILLEKAKDFPHNAPILIITDGAIEERINIHRDHAWLMPKRCKLPFQTKKPVFKFE